MTLSQLGLTRLGTVAEVRCSLYICKWTKGTFVSKIHHQPPLYLHCYFGKPGPIEQSQVLPSNFRTADLTSLYSKAELRKPRNLAQHRSLQSHSSQQLQREFEPETLFHNCFLECTLLGILIWTVLNPRPSRWLFPSTK